MSVKGVDMRGQHKKNCLRIVEVATVLTGTRKK